MVDGCQLEEIATMIVVLCCWQKGDSFLKCFGANYLTHLAKIYEEGGANVTTKYAQ